LDSGEVGLETVANVGDAIDAGNEIWRVNEGVRERRVGAQGGQEVVGVAVEGGSLGKYGLSYGDFGESKLVHF
jgi:hypothetical protein